MMTGHYPIPSWYQRSQGEVLLEIDPRALPNSFRQPQPKNKLYRYQTSTFPKTHLILINHWQRPPVPGIDLVLACHQYRFMRQTHRYSYITLLTRLMHEIQLAPPSGPLHRVWHPRSWGGPVPQRMAMTHPTTLML